MLMKVPLQCLLNTTRLNISLKIYLAMDGQLDEPVLQVCLLKDKYENISYIIRLNYHSVRSDEELTLETSASQTRYGG